MDFDLTINLGNIISLLAALIGVSIAYATIRSDLRSARESVAALKMLVEQMDDKQAAAAKRIEEVRAKAAHELAEFKLEAAKSYVTIEIIAKTEQRILDRLDRLDERLDRLDERLDKAARAG